MWTMWTWTTTGPLRGQHHEIWEPAGVVIYLTPGQCVQRSDANKLPLRTGPQQELFIVKDSSYCEYWYDSLVSLSLSGKKKIHLNLRPSDPLPHFRPQHCLFLDRWLRGPWHWGGWGGVIVVFNVWADTFLLTVAWGNINTYTENHGYCSRRQALTLVRHRKDMRDMLCNAWTIVNV